jgi:hypothetical protein
LQGMVNQHGVQRVRLEAGDISFHGQAHLPCPDLTASLTEPPLTDLSRLVLATHLPGGPTGYNSISIYNFQSPNQMRARQQELRFRTRGGKRRGAGRARRARHVALGPARPQKGASDPVTLRARRSLPSCASNSPSPEIDGRSAAPRGVGFGSSTFPCRPTTFTCSSRQTTGWRFRAGSPVRPSGSRGP